MENEEQNDFRLEGTGFAYTLSLINGKYKMPILYCLSKREVVRYNEMKRYLGKVTFKTLTDSLKALAYPLVSLAVGLYSHITIP